MTATTKTATVARTPNYSDSAVTTMIAEYSATPTRDTVNTLARQFNKNPRSIIAKLVREGVYKASVRVTKTGAPVVRKSALVAAIEGRLGVSCASFEKASKSDLERVVNALSIIAVQ